MNKFLLETIEFLEIVGCIALIVFIITLVFVIGVWLLFVIYNMINQLMAKYNPTPYLLNREEKRLVIYIKYKKIHSQFRKLQKRPFFQSLILYRFFKDSKDIKEAIEEFERFRTGEESIEEAELLLDKKDILVQEKLQLDESGKIIREKKKPCYSDLQKRYYTENANLRSNIIKRYITKHLIDTDVVDAGHASKALDKIKSISNIAEACSIIRQYAIIDSEVIREGVLDMYWDDILESERKVHSTDNEEEINKNEYTNDA